MKELTLRVSSKIPVTAVKGISELLDSGQFRSESQLVRIAIEKLLQANHVWHPEMAAQIEAETPTQNEVKMLYHKKLYTKYEHRCPNCRLRFFTENKNSKYCSRECARQAKLLPKTQKDRSYHQTGVGILQVETLEALNQKVKFNPFSSPKKEQLIKESIKATNIT